jgi:hypothetical protein
MKYGEGGIWSDARGKDRKRSTEETLKFERWKI